MKGFADSRSAVFLTCVALLLFSLPAAAHLMVAQKGTLKLGTGGYFFVISLPVSALSSFDDDGDGRLSSGELRTHKDQIETAVRAGFVLNSAAGGPRMIEGLLLNLPHHHGHGHRHASHVVAMGRFAVAAEDRSLTLQTNLFGGRANEQRFEITVTHEKQQEVLLLTKTQPTQRLFQKTRD